MHTADEQRQNGTVDGTSLLCIVTSLSFCQDMLGGA